MNANNSRNFFTIAVDALALKELSMDTDTQLREQECWVTSENHFRSVSRIVEPGSFLISKRYDPVKFNCAVRAICNEYGLQEHDVKGPLLQLHVFGVNTRNLSTEAIINLWDDHCYGDAANDFEYGEDFDAA